MKQETRMHLKQFSFLPARLRAHQDQAVRRGSRVRRGPATVKPAGEGTVGS
jgi:hypothetical protein